MRVVDDLRDGYFKLLQGGAHAIRWNEFASLKVALHFVEIGLGGFVARLLLFQVACDSGHDLLCAESAIVSALNRLGAQAFS